MKIVFLFMGRTSDKWIKEGLSVYLGRLKHYASLEVIEIPELKKKGGRSREEEMKKEAELILEKILPGDRLFLLDEKGDELTSTELSEWIGKQQLSGMKRLVLAIGGPFGFHEMARKKSSGSISLSPLTFTHQMVRVILAEQFYRAFTILKGEKYHHN
ncbi:MAG: 23S rRNA (pseudouridine(1915)-N(3))-methyltransferase RlmH [Bacteroidetes bacterium]|nr:23S rRNA (pseudouridine(1915)-N(3))-methyltransferase RlmH [Bacteroidota bacterium]